MNMLPKDWSDSIINFFQIIIIKFTPSLDPSDLRDKKIFSLRDNTRRAYLICSTLGFFV